jgi:hypothetical protein
MWSAKQVKSETLQLEWFTQFTTECSDAQVFEVRKSS